MAMLWSHQSHPGDPMPTGLCEPLAQNVRLLLLAFPQRLTQLPCKLHVINTLSLGGMIYTFLKADWNPELTNRKSVFGGERNVGILETKQNSSCICGIKAETITCFPHNLQQKFWDPSLRILSLTLGETLSPSEATSAPVKPRQHRGCPARPL